MKRLLSCIAAILFSSITTHAQSYGLVFGSHEVVQEKRTALDLSPDDSLCLGKEFTLSFDCNFLPRHEIYFGYIFRIVALGPGTEHNIDLIYNPALHAFKIIVGESFSGIIFSIDSSKLYREWNRFSLHADATAHTLQFSVNGHPVGTSPIPDIGTCLKILWGANDYRKYRTRDIPPMELKDIRLTSGSTNYYWPLDETTGEMASQRIDGAVPEKSDVHAAHVKNPIWLKPKYQQWELVGNFTINGYAGAAYNPKQDKLYIAGNDSIANYTFTKDGYSTEWTPTHHMEFLVGHQNIYDTVTDRLLDIFIDRHAVAAFNTSTRQWDQNFTFGPLTEYWHANKFLSPADSSLYVIGGYGQLHYKNGVQRYHFPTHHWDSLTTNGDHLPPHYLAALGSNDKYAWILGGYGSETGDQMLDPRNYYDLYQYDIKNRSVKKLHTLKTLGYPYTFANSLITSAKPGAWYALTFPNDSYNSQLQLIEGSFADSAIRLVGNTIPYNFHDVQSFADLYYSPLSNKLIAVTLFYSKYTADNQKDKNTTIRIYTLNSPPEPAQSSITVLSNPPSGHPMSWTPIISIVILLALATAVMLWARGRRKAETTGATLSKAETNPHGANSSPTAGNAEAGMPLAAHRMVDFSDPKSLERESVAYPSEAKGRNEATRGEAASTKFEGTSRVGEPSNPSEPNNPTNPTIEQPQPIAASSIYLFGPFQTIDATHTDSTRLFTPLLKELFLIITTYTIRNGRGISSEGLNELLWHDKPEKDAKNNRSVNLAKLKPILEKIGNCSIAKEGAYWQLHIPDNTFLDYKQFVKLVHDPTPPDTRRIHALIDIIKRGPFLFQTEYNWLDDIKSEVSNAVIDHCLQYLRTHEPTENPEFIIEIANCIFFFDQLNEDALTIKCKSLIKLKRHNLASNTYLKFAKDYKDIYNADFPRTFQQIIA